MRKKTKTIYEYEVFNDRRLFCNQKKGSAIKLSC